MTLSLIAAVAENRAIGLRNKLLYWLPDDLKRFKSLTSGHTIIMGRNTFLSLPKGALPNRRNIVLSRTASSADFPGAELFRSLNDAMLTCREDEEVFVIGGEQLYRSAISCADRLYLTHVHDTPAEADAFFPEVNEEIWQVACTVTHEKDERHAFAFDFIDWVRKK